MAEAENFKPFIPPEKSVPEWTVASVLLGTVLAVIMAAANTYAGLYAGMTASASIPAAVLSMGILKGVLRRGTILENNIVQTIASSGESLAAGVIFTVPALVITGVWTGFKFWPTTLIAMCGGLLGVLFMIPLRRNLIVEDRNLVYPEGFACAKVLEAGDTGGSGAAYVFSALGIGAIFKGLVGGVSIVKETAEGAFRIGKSAWYFGSDMSVLLLGIGYVVGLNIAILVFLGGVIAWFIAMPIYTAGHGIAGGTTLVDGMKQVWMNQIRFMGIGAMVVGGLASIVRMRGSISKSLSTAIYGHKHGEAALPIRTDTDMSQRWQIILTVASIAGVFAVYMYLTHAIGVTIVSTIVMVVASFFFVAVASYLVGLVGSSNSPVSGMTICAILFASGVLLLMGMKGQTGILAALGVAGVVCCAASSAGDISQDLKTGYFVGATPRYQQWGEVIGATVPAIVIAPVLTLLLKAYGIGTGGPRALAAPQAQLFANISTSMFTDKPMPWIMVGIGVVIGIVILVIDDILRRRQVGFRAHVMPLAVGIYLPFGLSVPILIGGLASLFVKRIAARHGDEEGAERRGVLLGSGLIAGEAVMGIILAFSMVGLGKNEAGKARLPIEVLKSSPVSLLLFAAAIALTIYLALRPSMAKRSDTKK
ncbi:MAG TPA: oligopeptide transporter, OPT family [bacterium]|nr:oligopeptide transporter, OPT family [bacterium]